MTERSGLVAGAGMTASLPANDDLEHFYYGQAVPSSPEGGQAGGALRLLAASSGVSQADIADAVAATLLPPLPGVPTGAWGVARGKSVPFVFVQSGVNERGGAVLHFVLLPVDLLRALGGNVRALVRLLDARLPVYDGRVSRLQSLRLPPAEPPDDTAQVDAMLALMTCVNNRLNLIEPLLSAVIKGVQIVVRNAPADTGERLALVEGLLALLPPPARFGVTFVTHSLPSTRIDALIRFASAGDDVNPAALTFDWSRGEVSGLVVSDDYSRFIVSQLRLDTSLVLEQTRALTAVAQWRIKRGDSLNDALSYGAHRLRLDNAVLANQPVEAAGAAQVLAEDPTLDDTLRSAYARHVLAFALALGDVERADAIGIQIRRQPALEASTLELLTEAVSAGKAGLVYRLLARWLANPLGPSGMNWTALFKAAAAAHLRALLDRRDVDAAAALLDEVDRAYAAGEPDAPLREALPVMVETALPLMRHDDALALRLFALAAAHLSAESFHRLLHEPVHLTRMPETMQHYANILRGKASGSGRGVIARALVPFDDDIGPLVLIRLVEAALMSDRLDLIDHHALTGLARAALTHHAAGYDTVFRWVVRNLSRDEALANLPLDSPPLLLRILLARRMYPELVQELARHLRLLYSSRDQQADYAAMVRRLFADVPLSTDEARHVLRLLQAGGVQPLPLAMAHLGVLQRLGWSPDLHDAILNLSSILASNPALIDAVSPAALMDVFQFHVGRGDTAQAARIGRLLPGIAARKGESGVTLMAQVVQALNREHGGKPDAAARALGLELLRAYIRELDESGARTAIHRLSDALGSEVSATLEAVWALRVLTGGAPLIEYTGEATATARLLHDTAVVYSDKKTMPGLKRLDSDLGSLAEGLTSLERDRLAATILDVGRAIAALGRPQRPMKPRDATAWNAQLLEGAADPRTALDALRALSGSLTEGRPTATSLERPIGAHPLGDRAAPTLLQDVQTAARVLRRLLRAFPPERELTLTADALRAELDSQIDALDPDERRAVRELGPAWQTIADLVAFIAERGDSRVLDDGSSQARRLDKLKQRPESTLDFYRFIHSYLKRK